MLHKERKRMYNFYASTSEASSVVRSFWPLSKHDQGGHSAPRSAILNIGTLVHSNVRDSNTLKLVLGFPVLTLWICLFKCVYILLRVLKVWYVRKGPWNFNCQRIYLKVHPCHWPELHLLAEGQIIPPLHHHLHQLAQFGFDLDGMDHVAQDAHIPEGWWAGQYTS